MLKKLTSIEDVQVGDYFLTKLLSSPTHRLVTVKKVNSKRRNFNYILSNNLWIINENELKEIILLRKTTQGLNILAGKEAYKELYTKPTKLETPKTGVRISGDAQFLHHPGTNLNDPEGLYNRPDGHQTHKKL